MTSPSLHCPTKRPRHVPNVARGMMTLPGAPAVGHIGHKAAAHGLGLVPDPDPSHTAALSPHVPKAVVLVSADPVPDTLMTPAHPVAANGLT